MPPEVSPRATFAAFVAFACSLLVAAIVCGTLRHLDLYLP